MKDLRKSLRKIADDQGFVTPSWFRMNPFWRLLLLVGGIAIGWGLNDMLGHHSSAGIWPLVTGTIAVIGGTALIEYLFSEEKDESVASNAKRPSSGDPSDD